MRDERVKGDGKGHVSSAASAITLQSISAMSNTGTMPSGKDLLARLHQELLTNVEERRAKHDDLVAKLIRRENEVGRLKLVLQDLAREGNALESPAESRSVLFSVPEVTTKKVFGERKRILGMLEEIEEAEAARKNDVGYSESMQHLLTRSMHDREKAEKEKIELVGLLREENLALGELRRREKKLQTSVLNARKHLAVLKREVDREMKKWQDEIKDRQRYLAERTRFDELQKEEMENQREMDLRAKKRDAGTAFSLQRKLIASRMRKNSMQTKLNNTIAATLASEMEFEDTFRRIGIVISDSNDAIHVKREASNLHSESDSGFEPSEVVQFCQEQSQKTRFLQMQREEEIALGEALKMEAREAKKALDEELSAADTRSERSLADMEEQFEAVRQDLEGAAQRHSALLTLQERMRVNIAALGARLLGQEISVHSANEANRTIRRAHVMLAQVRQETKSKSSMVEAMRDARARAIAEREGFQWTPAVTAIPADWKNPELVVSPYNVRVRGLRRKRRRAGRRRHAPSVVTDHLEENALEGGGGGGEVEREGGEVEREGGEVEREGGEEEHEEEDLTRALTNYAREAAEQFEADEAASSEIRSVPTRNDIKKMSMAHIKHIEKARRGKTRKELHAETIEKLASASRESEIEKMKRASQMQRLKARKKF